MYSIINLQNVPNQFVSTTVNSENITIELLTKTVYYNGIYDVINIKNYLFANIYKSNVKIGNFCPVINGQFILQYTKQTEKLNGNLFILDAVNTELNYNNFNKTAILYYTDENYPLQQQQKYFNKIYIQNNAFLTNPQIELMP